MFANGVSDEYREYSVKDLPEGRSGWLLTWGLSKNGDGSYKVHPDYPVEPNHYHGNHGLFIRKENGQVLIDKSTFDSFKEAFQLNQCRPNVVYYGELSVPFVDALIVEDLLPKPRNEGIEVSNRIFKRKKSNKPIYSKKIRCPSRRSRSSPSFLLKLNSMERSLEFEPKRRRTEE